MPLSPRLANKKHFISVCLSRPSLVLRVNRKAARHLPRGQGWQSMQLATAVRAKTLNSSVHRLLGSIRLWRVFTEFALSSFRLTVNGCYAIENLLILLLNENVFYFAMENRTTPQIRWSVAATLREWLLQISASTVIIPDLAKSVCVFGYSSEVVQREADVLHIEPVLILTGALQGFRFFARHRGTMLLDVHLRRT